MTGGNGRVKREAVYVPAIKAGAELLLDLIGQANERRNPSPL